MFFNLDENNNIINPSVIYGDKTSDLSYQVYINSPERYYIYDNVSKDVIVNPDFEQEQKAKERLRLDSIFLTKLQFFKSLKELHNISSVTIETMIKTSNNQDYIDEYNFSSGFLRGNPIFNILGALLEIPLTPLQIDEVFQNGLKY